MNDQNAHFIYDPFQIKDERSKKEINDDAMLVALTFIEEEEAGVYVVTKIKAEIEKISDIYPYENFVIAGVGNYSEFKEITTLIDIVILDSKSIYSPENITQQYLLGAVVENVKNYYRKEPKALGLELLLFTLHPAREQIFHGYRIKWDGDYHPVTNFAIIGGYNAPKNSQMDPASVRSIIKKQLGQLYENSKPDFQKVKTLANEFMEMDSIAGKLQAKKYSVPRIKILKNKNPQL